MEIYILNEDHEMRLKAPKARKWTFEPIFLSYIYGQQQNFILAKQEKL